MAKSDRLGGVQESKMCNECVIIADNPAALIELCGISMLERLLRALQRCGIKRATVLSSTPKLVSESLAGPAWPRARVDLRVCQRSDELVTVEQIVDVWPETAQVLLLIRGDAVFDIRLLCLLLRQDSTTALVDSAVPAESESLVASAQKASVGKLCGAALLQHKWVLEQSGPFDKAMRAGLEQRAVVGLDVAKQPSYDPGLRRKLRPFWFPTPSASNTRFAENVLLDSVQKGSLDLPALVHAPIEKFLISHLCRTSITPHQLTIAWIVLACATTILFALGHLIWGIVLALVVGILDGLDGKQARLKVETTAGGKIEHHLDSFFDVVWPIALAFHFYSSGRLPTAFYYLVVLLAGEGVDGIAKAIIYSGAGRLMTAPSMFDRFVRLIGGRRNIYIWVLAIALILGAPEKALIVMAWWELMTVVIDIPQAARMLILRQKTR